MDCVETMDKEKFSKIVSYGLLLGTFFFNRESRRPEVVTCVRHPKIKEIIDSMNLSSREYRIYNSGYSVKCCINAPSFIEKYKENRISNHAFLLDKHMIKMFDEEVFKYMVYSSGVVTFENDLSSRYSGIELPFSSYGDALVIRNLIKKEIGIVGNIKPMKFANKSHLTGFYILFKNENMNRLEELVGKPR